MVLSSETDPVKLVFISGHEFGKCALEGIMSSKEYCNNRLSLVKILALHPRHAVSTVGYSDLAANFYERSISVSYFNSVSSKQVFHVVSESHPDYLLVIGLSQLIPTKLLDLPASIKRSSNRNSTTHGCIGMHPTLLPIGRGRAPLPWTLINKLTETGVSVFFLEDGADEGGIILQDKFDVSDKENAKTLFNKTAMAHRRLGLELSKLLANRQVFSRPQLESAATLWPARRPSDGWLDFTRDARELELLVRALKTPYPSAFFCYNDAVVYVNSAKATDTSGASPGTIINVSKEKILKVACGKGSLYIESWRSGVDLNFEIENQIINERVVCIDA